MGWKASDLEKLLVIEDRFTCLQRVAADLPCIGGFLHKRVKSCALGKLKVEIDGVPNII